MENFRRPFLPGIAFGSKLSDRVDVTTKLSSRGQVVLPRSIRRKLGLLPGETFAVTVEDERIILTRSRMARIVSDPASGLPVLTVGTAPKLSSAQVAEMLAN